MKLRIKQILLFNDTGFVEFQVAVASILFGINFLFADGKSWSLTASIAIMPRIVWFVFLVSLGSLKMWAIVNHRNTLRVFFSMISIVIWSFWAVVMAQQGGLVWPLFFLVPMQMGWVIFRILIEGER